MNNLIIYVSFHLSLFLHTHTHGNFIPIFIQDILKDILEKIFYSRKNIKKSYCMNPYLSWVWKISVVGSSQSSI